MKVDLLCAADYADYFLLPNLGDIGRKSKANEVELTIMSHGAGTQTSVLLALAAYSHSIPLGLPGRIDLQFATFANVADDGTECEYPYVLDYMKRLQYMSVVPILQVSPSMWNPSLSSGGGLFDRYYERATMPFRLFRGCTDQYKVEPQLRFLSYLHEEANKLGVSLTFRQVIGYHAGEKSRANRFNAGLPYITPWFPLIEWGWGRKKTIEMFKSMLPQVSHVLGLPRLSGCWFCPFQRRGYVGEDGVPQHHTWVDLAVNHPKKLDMALNMESRSNERRVSQGKKPAYLYGKRPLSYWVSEENIKVATHQDTIGDECGSGYCMR